MSKLEQLLRSFFFSSAHTRGAVGLPRRTQARTLSLSRSLAGMGDGHIPGLRAHPIVFIGVGGVVNVVHPWSLSLCFALLWDKEKGQSPFPLF